MDHKSFLPEGLERDDDVSHVELRLKIKSDRDSSFAIGGLPPCQVLLASRILRRLVLVHDLGHRVRSGWIARITHVTLCVLLVTPSIQGGDHTVTFLPLCPAGIIGRQHVFSAYEQVPRCRVARALVTTNHVTSPRLLGLSCTVKGQC